MHMHLRQPRVESNEDEERVYNVGLFEMIVQIVMHDKLEIAVCSCTDGSRNSQSFLL